MAIVPEVKKETNKTMSGNYPQPAPTPQVAPWAQNIHQTNGGAPQLAESEPQGQVADKRRRRRVDRGSLQVGTIQTSAPPARPSPARSPGKPSIRDQMTALQPGHWFSVRGRAKLTVIKIATIVSRQSGRTFDVYDSNSAFNLNNEGDNDVDDSNNEGEKVVIVVRKA